MSNEPKPLPPQLLLFDGVCGLCNGLVDFLIRLDPRGVIGFAPLQGETAAALRAQHAIIPSTLETVVFVDQGRVYLRMKALFRSLRYLPWPWKLGTVFGVFPEFISRPLYALVASLRYRLFGKHETCRLPTPQERARFWP